MCFWNFKNLASAEAGCVSVRDFTECDVSQVKVTSLSINLLAGFLMPDFGNSKSVSRDVALAGIMNERAGHSF